MAEKYFLFEEPEISHCTTAETIDVTDLARQRNLEGPFPVVDPVSEMIDTITGVLFSVEIGEPASRLVNSYRFFVSLTDFSSILRIFSEKSFDLIDIF